MQLTRLGKTPPAPKSEEQIQMNLNNPFDVKLITQRTQSSFASSSESSDTTSPSIETKTQRRKSPLSPAANFINFLTQAVVGEPLIIYEEPKTVAKKGPESSSNLVGSRKSSSFSNSNLASPSNSEEDSVHLLKSVSEKLEKGSKSTEENSMAGIERNAVTKIEHLLKFYQSFLESLNEDIRKQEKARKERKESGKHFFTFDVRLMLKLDDYRFGEDNSFEYIRIDCKKELKNYLTKHANANHMEIDAKDVEEHAFHMVQNISEQAEHQMENDRRLGHSYRQLNKKKVEDVLGPDVAQRDVDSESHRISPETKKLIKALTTRKIVKILIEHLNMLKLIQQPISFLLSEAPI